MEKKLKKNEKNGKKIKKKKIFFKNLWIKF